MMRKSPLGARGGEELQCAISPADGVVEQNTSYVIGISPAFDVYIGRINEGLFQFKTEGEDNMTTQIIVVVGASIATVVLMFVLGKMADGKSDDTEKKDTEQKSCAVK